MSHSTSYRRVLNKLGYYNYHNALIHRHINQKGGWDTHLERCRNYILKIIDYTKPEKITVLGSGWLLDLPLVEILEKAGKVTLVDIIHPPAVFEHAGKMFNVELLEEDVTGGLIEEVWQKAGKYSFFNKLKSPEGITIPEYKPLFDPGLVISLNILTQLEILPLSFLKRRSSISDKEFSRLKAEIQKKHIDFLKKHRSVLISDFEEVFTDKSGNKTTIPTLMTGLPQGEFKEEWTWNFEQTGAYRYNSRSVMNVFAISII
jgi:hypothetical protein